MTDSQSTSMTPADAQKAILAIEKQLSTLRVFAGMSAELPLKKGRGKNKGKTETPDGEPKKKRELTPLIAAMNEERKQIFEELKASWAEKNADFTSLDAKALSLAVKNGEVDAKPRFSDALKEHSKRQREGDPEKQAKYEAYRAKTDEKQAAKKSGASSVASASDSGSVNESGAVPATGEVKKRKNPWLGLTDEQKEERKAKMAAGKEAAKKVREAALVAAPVAAAPSVAAPVAAPSASNPFDDAAATEAPASDAESATSSKKPGPPKGVKLSEEERVRRAAKAKATRAARAAAAVPLPASPPSSSASSVIVDEIDEETFTKQQIGSKIVYKNALGHVRAYTTEGAGIWLGMYDPVKKVIDASVPEPSE